VEPSCRTCGDHVENPGGSSGRFVGRLASAVVIGETKMPLVWRAHRRWRRCSQARPAPCPLRQKIARGRFAAPAGRRPDALPRDTASNCPGALHLSGREPPTSLPHAMKGRRARGSQDSEVSRWPRAPRPRRARQVAQTANAPGEAVMAVTDRNPASVTRQAA
jgi:hypothetical protein